MSYGNEEYEFEWPDNGDQNDGWGQDDQSENNENQPKVQIENYFYEGDAIMKDQPNEALEFFEKCVKLEEEQGDEIVHRFNATEKIVILSARLKLFDKLIENQKKIISMMNKVSRNDHEEAISNILDAVTKFLGDHPAEQMEVYNMTIGKVKIENEKLWFKISLRLGKIYLDNQDFTKLDALLSSLKESCKKKAGDNQGDQIMESSDQQIYDSGKSNLLLETYALEIQMCNKKQDTKRMKKIYPQTINLNAIINDPRVMGIIKECGGKMYMSEKKWDQALEELFDCFKNYQDSGNIKAKSILVYVILAGILSHSEIDHAQCREAKVYQDDKDIVSITQLRDAYIKNDIKRIQEILSNKKNKIFSDPEFVQYLEDLLRNIRLNVILYKVSPYNTIKIDFLSKELNISQREVRQLLSELILENKIDGSIDQSTGFLQINKQNKLDSRYQAMEEWTNSLINIHRQLQ